MFTIYILAMIGALTVLCMVCDVLDALWWKWTCHRYNKKLKSLQEEEHDANQLEPIVVESVPVLDRLPQMGLAGRSLQ